jgi:hypothetical protein
MKPQDKPDPPDPPGWTDRDLLLAVANLMMLLVLLAYYWTPLVFHYAALAATPIALLIIIRLTRGP